MIELTNHKIYALLKNEYKRVGLDYVILSVDTVNEPSNLEIHREAVNEPFSQETHRKAVNESSSQETHRKAVVEAFGILKERYAEFDYPINLELDKMVATAIGPDELLKLPPEDYDERKARGTKRGSRSFSIPKPLPYWFAFLEPPQGTPYTTEDFIAFNQVLFPNKEEVEVYSWNDDFSNYFDAGKEGWGTGLWSVLYRSGGQMVIIGASLTD